MGVEKVEGCNKMTCGYCGAFFCWACSAVISGYDHFVSHVMRLDTAADSGAASVLLGPWP